MKKLKFWLVGCLFTSLVAVVVVQVNLTYAPTDNGSLNLTNTEALAQGEGGYLECVGSGGIICGSGSYKVKYN